MVGIIILWVLAIITILLTGLLTNSTLKHTTKDELKECFIDLKNDIFTKPEKNK